MTTRESIDVVCGIAQRIQHENSDAVKLTWQTQRDSKALKAMTTVALLFLPASLLVVSRIAPSPKIF